MEGNHKLNYQIYEGYSTIYFCGDPEIAAKAYELIKEMLKEKK